MKVLFVSFEVSGIFKTGGLGDVAAALPKALKKKGVNVSILMPGYEGIKKPVLLPRTEIPVHYIKDHHYFDISKKFTHAENFERFFYFCFKAAELIQKEKPDIVHLNDWHCALVAYLLKFKNLVVSFQNQNGVKSDSKQLDKKQEPVYVPKIILTIHNAAFQGDFSLDYIDDFKNPETKNEFLKLGFKSRVNFLKNGIDYADFVTTVSPNYVDEMLYKKMGYGLEENLKKKENKFIGILNGIDYTIWNPETDDCLDYKYSLEPKKDLLNWSDGKKKNKAALQKKLKLPMDKNIPVIAFVARLSWQKGIEKIIESMVEISRMGVQLIILGQGDKYYEGKLIKLKEKYESRFLAVRLKFDEKLAHQIYAGADMFLIPSKYEPCGLTQMISMKYGTIPLARSTGGLVDSITNNETGFLFADDTPRPMLNAIKKATGLYYDWVDWEMITKNGNIKGGNTKNEKFLDWPKMVGKVMKEDFSWDKSAEKYLHIYNKLLDK